MTAFLFPGQGSQHAGMGAAWREHPSWELVAEASDVAGRDIAHLLVDAGTDELRATDNAQLATLVLSLVVLDAVERLGLEAAAYAGHSLGEYTALVASGAVAFTDGVRLVGARGEAMRRAAEHHAGSMAAIFSLDDDKVEIACARAEGDVWVANYNAPGQVVIAGEPGAVARAANEARHLGAGAARAVPVSGAFHTPLMAPAREPLRVAVAAVELRAPDSPVIANVDARPHEDPDDWAALLAAQLCSPVRWRQTLYRLEESGITTFVELGPGKVLTGLGKRTVKGRVLSVSTPDDLDTLLDDLHGHAPMPAGWHEGEHLFAHERLIVSAAAGVFRPDDGLRADHDLAVGQLVGVVGDQEVRSPFGGRIAGVLAVEGERVTVGQPIAWIRN